MSIKNIKQGKLPSDGNKNIGHLAVLEKEFGLIIQQAYKYNKQQMQSQPLLKLANCENCQREIQQQKIDLHFSYCSKYFKKCQLCSIMIDTRTKQEHLQQYHKLEKCSHCKKQFLLAAYQAHKKQCGPKFLLCVHCSLKIPQAMFYQHSKVCGSRTTVCQICQQPVKMSQILNHQQQCFKTLDNGDQSMKGMKKVKIDNRQQKRPNSVAVDLFNRPTSRNLKKQLERPKQSDKTREYRRQKQKQIKKHQRQEQEERKKQERQKQKEKQLQKKRLAALKLGQQQEDLYEQFRQDPSVQEIEISQSEPKIKENSKNGQN